MDLVLDTAAAVERHRQSCWLHELHVEAKRLQKQAQEAQRHYTATLSTLKSLAHTYENINCLLVSVSRYFSEVSIGSRIGVGTNVEKFKNLVTTMEESPQCKKLQVLLKKQIDDADELKASCGPSPAGPALSFSSCRTATRAAYSQRRTPSAPHMGIRRRVWCRTRLSRRKPVRQQQQQPQWQRILSQQKETHRLGDTG